jgi:hypothetical protein
MKNLLLRNKLNMKASAILGQAKALGELGGRLKLPI